MLTLYDSTQAAALQLTPLCESLYCSFRSQNVYFISETSSLHWQKRHPYTGRNVSPETYGDGKNALLHCGDVLAGPLLTNELHMDTESW